MSEQNELPEPEGFRLRVFNRNDLKLEDYYYLDKILRAANPSPGERKWDKSGLKEACQRALRLGRTHQETDIQLFLDMLLEIERLEATPSPSVGECIEEVKRLKVDYQKQSASTNDYELGASLDTAVEALDEAISALEALKGKAPELDALEFWADLAEVLGRERPTIADIPALVSEVRERLRPASEQARKAAERLFAALPRISLRT